MSSASSESDTDNESVSQECVSGIEEGYMFEPIASNGEETDQDSDDSEDIDRLQNTNW